MPKNRAFLLILVCAALGVLVFLDHWGADDGIVASTAPRREQAGSPAEEIAESAPAGAAEPVALAKRLVNPLADFDKSRLKAWTERPLFAPSRKRPPQVASAPTGPVLQVKSTQPASSYDLLGIIRDGSRAIALLRKKGEGTSFRVEVGDMIGGWRVAKMEPASVVLERMDGTAQTVAVKRD